MSLGTKNRSLSPGKFLSKRFHRAYQRNYYFLLSNEFEDVLSNTEKYEGDIPTFCDHRDHQEDRESEHPRKDKEHGPSPTQPHNDEKLHYLKY